MKFKVGDKVKCMDASNSSLEYGKVYEVSNAFSGACDGYVNLVNEGASGWSTSRFELVKEEVSMHKFKVGDVVKIVGAVDDNHEKWNGAEGFNNTWACAMDNFIGKVCKVTSITTYGITLTGCGDYRFPPQALELYTEEMKIQKDKKYRVVGTHEPVRIICTDKASKLQCVALYTDHRGDEGLLLVSDDGLNCWGVKFIEEVPESDWSKVEVDAPLWIKISSDSRVYSRRHFAEFKYGYVYFYADGLTSHTGSLVLSVVKENASLTDPNEKA